MREYTYRCEGPDCETWGQGIKKPPVRGWVLIIEIDANDQVVEHDYCSWDCVMKDAARVDPPRVIEMGPEL